MTEPTQQQKRGVAMTFLGEDVLVRLLQLPAGWRIEGLHQDFLRNGITLRITGPGIPGTEPGQMPYELPSPAWEYEAPSPDELAANPSVAGRVRVLLPDWLTGIAP